MARFFERRDNQYVSGYSPLPIGLMQKAAEVRQQQKDTLEGNMAELKPYTGEAIDVLSHNGQVTDDYKKIQEWNNTIIDNVNKFSNELKSSDDIEGIARKVNAFRVRKFGEESQGGSLYQITENKKARDEFIKELDKSDMLPATKEAMLRENDLKYERQGFYKGLGYKDAALLKYTDVGKDLNTYLSGLPANLDIANSSYNIDKIPGFIEKTKSSTKIRSNAKLFAAGLDYLHEDGIVNENVKRQIANEAERVAITARREAIDGGIPVNEADAIYDKNYQNEINRQMEAFNPANFNVDEAGNAHTLQNTVVNEYVSRGARDYKYKETMTGADIDALPGMSFGAGNKPIIPQVLQVDSEIYSDPKTYGEVRNEVKTLKDRIAETQKRIDGYGKKEGKTKEDISVIEREQAKLSNMKQTLHQYSNLTKEMDTDFADLANAIGGDVYEELSKKGKEAVNTFLIENNLSNRGNSKEVIQNYFKKNIADKGESVDLLTLDKTTPLDRVLMFTPVGQANAVAKSLKGMGTTIGYNSKISNIKDKKYTQSVRSSGLIGADKTNIGGLAELNDEAFLPIGNQIDTNGDDITVKDKKDVKAPIFEYANAGNNYEFQWKWEVVDADGNKKFVRKPVGGIRRQALDAALLDINAQINNDKLSKEQRDDWVKTGQEIGAANDIQKQIDTQYPNSGSTGKPVDVFIKGKKFRFVKTSKDPNYNTYTLQDDAGNSITQGGKEIKAEGADGIFSKAAAINAGDF